MIRKALAGAAFAVLIAGGPAAAEVTVHLMHVNQANDPLWKAIAEAYNKSHPGTTVVVDYMENEAYKAKLPTLLQSADKPGIIFSWGGGVMRAQIEAGYVQDISASKADLDKAVYAAGLNAFTVDGKLYGVPTDFNEVSIYYNKALFKKAGITAPPKTIAELTADAKKLTKRNPDGSLKVVGLDPFIGFYENVPERWAAAFGGKYIDAKGNAILADQAAWPRMLKWQKALVDWYGYNNLVKFQAGLGDEFSTSNAFEAGKLAMNLDGEWRVAFIANEHPSLQYGTAPIPVDDAQPGLYGSGYINGTIIGIPKNGKHTAQAWDLVKYLTTNVHALSELANGLRNVPSTTASTHSKELIPDANFATFLKIFANPKSSTSPIMASGASYTNLVQNFMTKWQAGKVSVKSLPSALKDLDKQLDAQVKQAKGGGGVP
jgi:multiple sugar transport system substrate-binding protein